MDAKIVKDTQDSLGKIIKKPPLTEKLLTKPPFRFLHDIMTSVVRTTGFMQGLFTEEEMNSENVKDKDSKMEFLQKVVDLVSLVSGKQLHIKTSKIVAGHEAEKTNILLQYLAESINKNVNCEKYVQKVLERQNGKEKAKENTTHKPKHERTRKDKTSNDVDTDERVDETKTSQSGGKELNDDRKQRAKEKDRTRDKHSSKSREKSQETNRDRSDSNVDVGHKVVDNEKSQEIPQIEQRDDKYGSRSVQQKDEAERESQMARNPGAVPGKERSPKKRQRDKQGASSGELSKEQPITVADIQSGRDARHGDTLTAADTLVNRKMERPTSAKGSRRRRDGLGANDNNPEELVVQQLQEEMQSASTDDVPPQILDARLMQRPSSARPAPPQLKKQENLAEEPNIRLGSGRPTQVIMDNAPSDDDELFLVEESTVPLHESEPVKRVTEVDEDSDHGGLVRKMLESKKELEEGSQKQNKKTEIVLYLCANERPTLSDAARRKERNLIQKEVDKLRECIQTLTRSAHPLSKIMDYVQEDIDAMQAELKEWVAENRQQALALNREQGITNKAIEPLRAHLVEVDDVITDQLEKIVAIKSKISSNDKKIDKMLRSINKS